MKIKIDIDGQEKTFDIPTESDRAEAWEKRCQELEQENRELKADLDKLTVDYENEIQDLRHDHREMLDRIHDQDMTIAKYDDENRALKERYISWDRGSTALTRWAKAIHENAIEHGWWEDERSFGDIVALCHSELSEALEEYRNGKPMAYINDSVYKLLSAQFEERPNTDTPINEWPAGRKPEGAAVEMIDCVIRILDWCGKEGIDVDEILRKKHEYNKTRPYRHGGKKL